MYDSVRPHRRQPTRLSRPWDSQSKNTGLGCHFVQCMKVKSESEVTQSCLTFSDTMDSRWSRLLHLWEFPGKSTGVGCHCLLHLSHQRAHQTSVWQWFCYSMDCSLYSEYSRPYHATLKFSSRVNLLLCLFLIVLVLLLLFSCSVVWLLWPHGLQHSKLPCPSPSPRAWSNSCALNQWYYPPSHPLLFPSPPAFNLSQHQGLFWRVTFLHQVAKVLELQLQHQFFQWIFRIDFL